jgi:hypothetical protein
VIDSACELLGIMLKYLNRTLRRRTPEGEAAAVSQPQPQDAPRSPQRRWRKAGERYRRGQPLTREDLKELGDGGPWESDEEFDRWLAALCESRQAT